MNHRRATDQWIVDQKDQSNTERLNTRVLRYFEMAGKDLSGLAATRIQDGERVWQFPSQRPAFITRADEADSQIRILGRRYLFSTSNGGPLEHVKYATLTLDEVRQRGQLNQCYDLRISPFDMLTLTAEECFRLVTVIRGRGRLKDKKGSFPTLPQRPRPLQRSPMRT